MHSFHITHPLPFPPTSHIPFLNFNYLQPTPPTSTNLPFPHISVPFLTFSSPSSTPIFKPYLNFPLLTSGADTGGGAGPLHPPDRFREGRSPPESSRQKMFPICYNNFLNLFNRLYPFFKLFDIKYKNKKLGISNH